MAIAFARARYVSRSAGGSAVRSSAYNGRDTLWAERTGEVYSFQHRDAPEFHDVLLPEGAAERFRVPGALWNAAEAAERRKDAQVAREIVLALPANAEVTSEDRIALARSFAEQHFVAKGLAVQLDVHAPHDAEEKGERTNWHAHLLITTRRIEGDRFSARKARDLDPEVRSAGGRARVADGAAWGELWREHQDRYFREQGIEARVDPTATHPQEHIGPVRMRRAGSEILERAETIRQANQEAARDPEQVLATLTRNNATFTERDLDRYLAKHIDEPAARAAVKAKVFEHQGIVALHDRETGEAAGRFTTRTVRDEERKALNRASFLAHMRGGTVSAKSAEEAVMERSLRPDQEAAFAHATGAGGIKLIEGRAGTGKSYTLAAIRDAYERDAKRVVGLAPTNAVAQDLAGDGFREARTVHAALFALKNGRVTWDKQTVVIVDEAAMLDTKVTGELLAAARDARAKVILAGDDRQLASIERGGLFSELKQRHGTAEISEVTRQRVDWQRQAARDLAEGRFAAAVTAYDRAGAITWTQNRDEARKALVEAWRRDTAAQPHAARFVFAYTNRDVDALNAELRRVRRDRGEFAGPDVRLETKHGEAAFAIGDRAQFTDTDKKARIYNGNVGTITGLDARTGQLTAKLDSGRVVSWSVSEFQGFRHGYAGTIYKGQGKTLDHTYLYHTEHWRAAASYVALTRQRESAQVFVARETARDVGQLARQMARGEVKAASVAWATQDELTTARQEGPVERVATFWQAEPVQSDPARDEDALRRKREVLKTQQRVNAKSGELEAKLSPDGQAARAGKSARAAEHQAAGRDAPERAKDAPAPTAKRGKFAGLRLKADHGAEASRALAESLRAELQEPPPRHARTLTEPERQQARLRGMVADYARAWSDAERMRQAALPVLPHQAVALERAGRALEEFGDGLGQDVRVALERAPELAREIGTAEGRQALTAAATGMRRERLELEERGRETVRAWDRLEREYEAAGKDYEWNAQRAVGTRMEAFAKELKRDPQLDNLLRERGRELGIIEGSRLERVVRAREIDRRLTRELDIEHGPRRIRGMSLGM